ncbi:MAG TPA: GEVED domain-containing protein, partial [Bacteroidales bacterium]|nr:GEVED domain-containing protein [Bacteroidales bacterium]
PNHYFQMVNLAFEIFDKNGNSLYGPADNITLWNGFSGPWSSTNDGDPIVLYDEYADRWIASQFALPNYPSGPFYELIAVSETGDPTGAWYRYAYAFDNMPDYPKFGVWPDGYYFTINQFAPPRLSFAGAGVCVVDRDAMLTGDPNAELVFFNLPNEGSLLPADADGDAPPAGSPNYLATLYTGSVKIFEVDMDWANTGNSTISSGFFIGISPFSYSSIIINQPGTSQTLDALSTRLMYRLQYRNFGSYEVMLTNHTVNVGNGQAGVRWYEFRNDGSGWELYQEGTFAPNDGDDRWMGSVAMNGNGDIAVGYSVSSTNTYPSIRIAGQTAANSGTGVLDVAETSIKEGSASQTGVNRWGDYSMMSVDPVDDATFWYTTEYSNGGWNWRTQIASFNYGPTPPPTANFTASPNPAMQGQEVSFSDLSTNNPTNWAWTFEGGTPATSNAQNPVVTYAATGSFDVTLEVQNGSGSDILSLTDYITIVEPSYCTSSGSNTTRGWIQSFSLGNYTKNSGDNNGYADFTSDLIQVESGQSYNLTGTPGFPGRSQREFWRVWIDYNQDYDFSDPGEEVFAANSQKSTVTGTVTIPGGLSGETRMRVSMQYNTAPGPCDNFTYGEVEEYTITFGTPVPQPPVADFSGSPTNLAEGGSVQFSDQSLNNPTSWSWSFPGGTPSSSTEQNPLVQYTGVGNFDVSLTATNAQGSDNITLTGYITVTAGGGGTGDYCTSASQSNDLEWISEVNIGGISNTSGASLYSDFTATIIGLAPGSSNNIILTPYFNGKTQREFWRIWIDFNSDGDFEDADETVFVANNQRDVVNGSIAIPSYASGQTRMRITMKNGSSPSPCETFSNGEVEDYTVDFGSAPAVLERVQELDINLYPNPAGNELNIEISSAGNNVNLKVYNALGRIIDDFNSSDRQIKLDLGNFGAGIYYIGADDGKQTMLKKFIKK